MPGDPPQHESSPRRPTRRNHAHPVQQPGTRGGTGLPIRAAGRGPSPRSRTALAAAPPSVALTTAAVAGPSAAVLSAARARICAVPRWDDGPLVGRAEELAALLGHVDRAVTGRGSAVLLAGDAGVGKTRLLDELAARAVDRGVQVLVGRCVDLGDVGLPYLPF